MTPSDLNRGNASTHILIVGAGLAGSLMACYLVRDGYRVSVYERRSDPRAAGYVGGRSINLALSARGLAGLAGAGLAARVMERDAIPMRGRMIHPAGIGKSLIFQPYSHDPNDAINSVSRGGLNLTLLEAAAAYPNVSLLFDQMCLDIDLDAPAAVFKGPGGEVPVAADLIIGADGAFSAVRAKLQKLDRFEYSQSYLEHGYKELNIPPGPGGQAILEQNALHIWPRGGAMMISLPNRDGSFTCTLFWPMKGEHSFDVVKSPGQALKFFEAHYPDAVPVMPTLAQDFFRNPTGSLVTVRCSPWQHGGNVVMLGDAAHAIVPFYGQGMNAAFEDCLSLANLLKAHAPVRSNAGRLDFSQALLAFEAERKPNADAIADMAVENFVEMRDKTGSPAFLYKKKVEQAIHHQFPQRVTPQYNLVSFSTVPYVEARKRGRELDGVVEQVIAALPRGSFEELGEGAWKGRIEKIAGALLSGAAAEPPAPKLIDITPAVTEKLGVWPGDTPCSREVLCDIARGDTVTLSTLRATVHLGAHADGPNHYGLNQPGIGERRLDHYIGACHVLAARVACGGRVGVADVAGLDIIRHPRVLVRTRTFPDPNRWNSDFAALSVELVEALAARGVITIGIDTPSVDPQDSKDLRAHKAILAHDIAILEGLDLSEAAPGEYELIALPLKLMGFDASPVRAVLRPLA